MYKEKENLNLILLNMGCAMHNADWNWEKISSPFTRLYLVKEGKAKIHFLNFTQELKPNYLYLIPSFTMHSYECMDYFSLYYIHIYDEQISNISLLEQLNFPTEIEATTLDSLLIKRLLDINPGRELKRYDPYYYDNSSTLLRNIAENAQYPYFLGTETKGILLQLFSRFLEHATSKSEVNDNRILKVMHYIGKNIDKTISTNQLAQICHLSDDHFIRLFKKEMKSTPLQYINQKKIEKAQLMLIINNLPIKDIAYSLSFDNLSYFNRLFKKLTGLTPGNYKDNERNENK